MKEFSHVGFAKAECHLMTSDDRLPHAPTERCTQAAATGDHPEGSGSAVQRGKLLLPRR
jgi:hypothetical protein